MNVWHIWGLTYDYIHMCIPGLQLGQSMFVSFVLCSTWISGSGRGTAGSGSCGHVKPKTGGNMFTWILQTLRHDLLHIYLLLICDVLYQSGAGWHDHVHRIVRGSGFNQSLSPAWGTQDVPFDIRHLYSFSAKWFWNSVGCWNIQLFREGVIVGVVWYKIYIYYVYYVTM